MLKEQFETNFMIIGAILIFYPCTNFKLTYDLFCHITPQPLVVWAKTLYFCDPWDQTNNLAYL